MSDLPKGWIKLKINEIYSVIKERGETNKTPYLEIGDIDISSKNYKLKSKVSVKGCKKANKDDVVISRIRPTRGAISLILENNTQISSGLTLLRNENKLNKKLLFYQLAWNEDFLNTLGNSCTGTMYPTVSEEIITNYTIKIPPLNEQNRIVKKLDKLLVRVEAAKDRLNKIPGILKKYRQAVLHTAVTGELTKKWREENNKDFDWQKRLLKDISDLRLGKMLDKAKNKGTNTKYLRNINVRWFSFNLEDLADIKTTQEENEKLDIKNGDLLVCEGGEPGRCAVWEGGSNNLTFQKAIHRVRVHKNISPKWIAYNLKNDADNRELEEYFTGTTIKHLTGKSLKLYEIQIPPLEEQKEIVYRVEKLLSKAVEIEARYKKAKEYVDKLSQSILAKAFRGELVPQDPNDEPAEKLLEKIKAEKKAEEKKKKHPIKRHK